MDPTYDDRALVRGGALVLSDLHVGRGTGGNLSMPVGSGTERCPLPPVLRRRLAPAAASAPQGPSGLSTQIAYWAIDAIVSSTRIEIEHQS